MKYDITSFKYDSENRTLYILVSNKWTKVKDIRVFKNLGDLALDYNQISNDVKIAWRKNPVEVNFKRYLTDNDIAQFILVNGVMVTVGVTPDLRELLEKVIVYDAGRFNDFKRWDNI